MKWLATFATFGLGTLATPAHAQQTIADLVEQTNENALGPMADLVLNVAWVSGVGAILFAGFMLFKSGRGHHHEQLNFGKLVGLVVAGTLLIAFPASVGVGPASIFGGEPDTASIGGELRSLGGN